MNLYEITAKPSRVRSIAAHLSDKRWKEQFLAALRSAILAMNRDDGKQRDLFVSTLVELSSFKTWSSLSLIEIATAASAGEQSVRELFLSCLPRSLRPQVRDKLDKIKLVGTRRTVAAYPMVDIFEHSIDRFQMVVARDFHPRELHPAHDLSNIVVGLVDEAHLAEAERYSPHSTEVSVTIASSTRNILGQAHTFSPARTQPDRKSLTSRRLKATP